MREYTNLLWPEGPFGADRRPFGKPSPMIAAFTVDWTAQDLPAAAAAAYLRVKRAGTVEVSPVTMNPGLVAVAAEEQADPLRIVGWLDRGLVRARRHATVLAGHNLADTLTAASTLVDKPLAGLTGVAASWAVRGNKERGTARMIDTASSLDDPQAFAQRLSAPLRRATPAVWPQTAETQTDAALSCLVRCLAVGLAAAWQVEAYRWDLSGGPLSVERAVAHAAWDTFTGSAQVAS